MGIFGSGFVNKSFRTGSIFSPWKQNPGIIEQVGILFRDVETEGKKQGYERAANEYRIVCQELEKEFNETKEFIKEQKNSYGLKSELLISKLELLEKEKADLEKQVSRKIEAVSIKYNIPVGDVTRSLTVGTVLSGKTAIYDMVLIVYNNKTRKLHEAEKRGYAEAKKLYEEKINKLKIDLSALMEDGNEKIKEFVDMISNILFDIADQQMKIAELKILL